MLIAGGLTIGKSQKLGTISRQAVVYVTMTTRWFIQGAITVLEAALAKEAGLLDDARDEGQPANGHAIFNCSDRA
jgi:hypothetical protein